MIELYIPHWHPAPLNQIIGGRHWAKGHRLKKRDRQIVWAYAQGLPKADGPRRVELTIILRKGQRAADPDAYFKSACDALKQAGLIVDDNRQNVELSPVRFERGTDTEWGTRIVVNHIPPR